MSEPHQVSGLGKTASELGVEWGIRAPHRTRPLPLLEGYLDLQGLYYVVDSVLELGSLVRIRTENGIVYRPKEPATWADVAELARGVIVQGRLCPAEGGIVDGDQPVLW